MNGMLSIVHFSTAENEGGSGRSAHRIHSGLRALGHSSRMLVGRKTSANPDVDTVHAGRAGRIADRIADISTSAIGLQYQYLPSSRRVLRHPWVKESDVIQLYNTHGGYFSHRMLPLLSAMAPIVWRLSDMWPVTGHCAYAGSCDNWKTGCGGCCSLDNYPPIRIDTAKFLWNQKRKLYARSRITVVAPSSWTEGVARQSELLGDKEIVRIPNGLDIQRFASQPKEEAKKRVGLPPDSVVILFIANEVSENQRKGSSELVAALDLLQTNANVRVLLVGVGGEKLGAQLRQPFTNLGYLSSDDELAWAYSAADITVAPSMDENLPNTILESMACSTPVVAYDTGGIRDAVIDGETGLLVSRGNRSAMAAAISRLVMDVGFRTRLGAGARSLVEREYSADIQTRRFESLYQRLVGH